MDGPINGISFTAWVGPFLVPTLGRGDRVIADDLGSHAGNAVCHAIRGAGAKPFFLAAYSPDLDPTERVFARPRTLLRKADGRSIEATWRTIGGLLSNSTAEECAAYLRHAGYAAIQT